MRFQSRPAGDSEGPCGLPGARGHHVGDAWCTLSYYTSWLLLSIVKELLVPTSAKLKTMWDLVLRWQSWALELFLSMEFRTKSFSSKLKVLLFWQAFGQSAMTCWDSQALPLYCDCLYNKCIINGIFAHLLFNHDSLIMIISFVT